MSRHPAAVIIFSAAAVLGLAAAGPSAAAPDDPRSVMVGGQAGDGAMMGGQFVVTDITIGPAGQLLAHGTVSAALTGPPGSTQRRLRAPMTLPVDRGASVGHCRNLDLYLGPGDVTMAGVPVRVDRTDFNIPLQKGPGSRLMMPLCAVADLLPSDDTIGLRDALNQVFDLLGAAARS